MYDRDPNPYESPQAPSPPYQKLGAVGRFFAGLLIVVATLASFAVCGFSVCLAGVSATGQGAYRVPSAGAWWVIGFLSVGAGIGAGVVVAKVLIRLLFHRSHDG
ncbi:hypothetical protein Pla123a_22150 [Posidoniimonas polymericola]|uniref:Uncharacterized protein n=1 Tax=Posidoniimonas polymericola TaxID=2528002 RepID=A0A5C5YRG8_9BACT|nr:hypothetical protein [Posidoniimonas polymericola]TWT77554.1 hypothetical protein Pla123a_22150 [Posidoniimonas polymericola]